MICKCGCGLECSDYTTTGKPRQFINGHNTPRMKDDTPETFVRFEMIKREVEKCELLCSNCHRLIHGGEY